MRSQTHAQAQAARHDAADFSFNDGVGVQVAGIAAKLDKLRQEHRAKPTAQIAQAARRYVEYIPSKVCLTDDPGLVHTARIVRAASYFNPRADASKPVRGLFGLFSKHSYAVENDAAAKYVSALLNLELTAAPFAKQSLTQMSHRLVDLAPGMHVGEVASLLAAAAKYDVTTDGFIEPLAQQAACFAESATLRDLCRCFAQLSRAHRSIGDSYALTVRPILQPRLREATADDVANVLRGVANLGATAAHVTHRRFVIHVADRAVETVASSSSLTLADSLNSLRKLDFPHLTYVKKAIARQAAMPPSDTGDDITAIASTLRAGHHFGCLEATVAEALLDRVAAVPVGVAPRGDAAGAVLFAIATVRTWHEPAVRRLLSMLAHDVGRMSDAQLVRTLWAVAVLELHRQPAADSIASIAIQNVCKEIGVARGGFPADDALVALATDAVGRIQRDPACSQAARAALSLVT